MNELKTMLSLRDAGRTPAEIAAILNSNPDRYREQAATLNDILRKLVGTGNPESQVIVDTVLTLLGNAATQSPTVKSEYDAIMAKQSIDMGSAILQTTLRTICNDAPECKPAVDAVLGLFPLDPAPLTEADVITQLDEWDAAEVIRQQEEAEREAAEQAETERKARWQAFRLRFAEAQNTHLASVDFDDLTDGEPPTDEQLQTAYNGMATYFGA